MIKRIAEISINITLWILSTYLIIRVFSFESENIDEINGVQTITKVYNNRLEYAILITLFLKLIFFYLNVFYLTKLLFDKKYFKYFISLLGLIITFIVFEKLIIAYNCSELCFQKYLNFGIGLYAFYTLISLIYSFLIQWHKDQRNKIELQQQKTTAELKLLRSQINPHFLFNALNNLLSISETEGKNKVSMGISQLSELLRFLIYDTSTNKILLSKEIDFIENFIELNKLRYDEKDSITINFNIEGKVNEIMISPTLLIPFVENAFKHGIDIYEQSYVKITIRVTNDKLFFKVWNSCHSTENSSEFDSENSGIGLENVKKRLEILYPDKYILDIVKTENKFAVNLELIL